MASAAAAEEARRTKTRLRRATPRRGSSPGSPWTRLSERRGRNLPSDEDQEKIKIKKGQLQGM